MSFKPLTNFASIFRRFGENIRSPKITNVLYTKQTCHFDIDPMNMGVVMCFGFGAWFTLANNKDTQPKQVNYYQEIVQGSLDARYQLNKSHNFRMFKKFLKNHHTPDIEHKYHISRDELILKLQKDIELCSLDTLVHFRMSKKRGIGISTLVREACHRIMNKNGRITISNQEQKNHDLENKTDSSHPNTNDSILAKKVFIFHSIHFTVSLFNLFFMYYALVF